MTFLVTGANPMGVKEQWVFSLRISKLTFSRIQCCIWTWARIGKQPLGSSCITSCHLLLHIQMVLKSHSNTNPHQQVFVSFVSLYINIEWCLFFSLPFPQSNEWQCFGWCGVYAFGQPSCQWWHEEELAWGHHPGSTQPSGAQTVSWTLQCKYNAWRRYIKIKLLFVVEEHYLKL